MRFLNKTAQGTDSDMLQSLIDSYSNKNPAQKGDPIDESLADVPQDLDTPELWIPMATILVKSGNPVYIYSTENTMLVFDELRYVNKACSFYHYNSVH